MNSVNVFCAAVLGLAATAAGCGASMQPPVERLAATDAAIRTARELGAPSDPQASLYLKLADDQTVMARQLMHDGENKRADLVLQRAKSDAELSVMMTKERNAKADADKSRQALDADRAAGGGVR